MLELGVQAFLLRLRLVAWDYMVLELALGIVGVLPFLVSCLYQLQVPIDLQALDTYRWKRRQSDIDYLLFPILVLFLSVQVERRLEQLLLVPDETVCPNQLVVLPFDLNLGHQ